MTAKKWMLACVFFAFLFRLGELVFSSFWLSLSSAAGAGPLDEADRRLLFRGGCRPELESSVSGNTAHSLPS